VVYQHQQHYTLNRSKDLNHQDIIITDNHQFKDTINKHQRPNSQIINKLTSAVMVRRILTTE
jgi:hypothetical protein